ncbi:MAG: lysozyme inhibitor LprI family protein [Vitreimonas sp.]
MRRTLMVLALIAASCSPAPPQTAETPPAQEPTATVQHASVQACVAAAATHEQLWQCKGVVATPCMDTPEGQTTAGMIDCNSREAQAWQGLLDAELTRLQADDPTRKEPLAAANAAWRAWRDAECSYQAGEAEGGSLAGVIAAGCEADVTADRVIASTWADRAAAQ